MLRKLTRPVRRKLRLINYYSADRPRTGWSRFYDLAPLAGLVLALLASWASDALITQSRVLDHYQGRIARDGRSDFTAWVLRDRDVGSPWPSDRPPAGTFTVEIYELRHGWPSVSTITTPPPRVDLRLYDLLDPKTNVELQQDDPAENAVADALDAHGLGTFVDAIRSDRVETQRHLGAWVLNGAVWWVGLTLALLITLRIAHLAAHVLTFRKRRRDRELRQQGVCPSCGYDLRGLEFTDRCPECGEIAW